MLNDFEGEAPIKDLTPEDFDNVFIGGETNNPLTGTTEDDWTDGRAGTDRIDGGAGRDYIIAGEGSDWYVLGGSGADWFQFSLGDGGIGVADFEDGVDRICLVGMTFEDLTLSTSTFNEITSVVLTTVAGDRMILRDEALENITADDFDVIPGDPVDPVDPVEPFDPGEKPFDPELFDTFYAGSDGADPHVGTSGNDWIEGGGGADQIFGGAGRDYIIAGEGGDWFVRGGSGADWFQFGLGDGGIGVADFEDGADRICLVGLTFDDLSLSTSTFNDVTSVVLTTVQGDRMFIRNQTLEDITAEDFDTILDLA